MTDQEKEIAYYKDGHKGIPPAFIPKRVFIPSTVRADGPWSATVVRPGEYDCESNRYGAISIQAENGRLLGIKPKEFDVIEWAVNPHLDPKDLRPLL